MKYIKYIFLCFLLAVSINLKSQESLMNYLEIAAENNPSVKSKFYDYQAALEVIPQSSSLPDPQIAFAYFIQPVETRLGPQIFKLSASQMFPWFGTVKAMENAAVYSAKEKYEQFEQAKSELFYQVKTAYFDLYLINKSIEIRKDKIDFLSSINNIALSKSETGSDRLVNILRTEMKIADLQNQLELLEDNKEVQLFKFKNLLNSKEEMLILLPDTLWNDEFSLSKEAALDSIKRSNHQLARLEMNAITLKYKEDLAEKSGKPKMTLGIDYINTGTYDNLALSSNMNGRDAIVFPQVGLSLPLNRSKYKAGVKEAVFLQQANNETQLEQTIILENLFEKALNDYNDANRRLLHFEKQSMLGNKALSLLKVEYSNAGDGFDELLDMEKDLLEYELNMEKGRSDKLAALAFINYLMGN
jgi:cobalt-zinc-cadmium efflux system outer membrane protein